MTLPSATSVAPRATWRTEHAWPSDWRVAWSAPAKAAQLESADSSVATGATVLRGLPSPLKSSGTLAMDIPGLLYGRHGTQR